MAGLSFSQHIALTTPQVQRYQRWLFYSAIATTISLNSAFFGREVLPPKVRSLLLITSAATSVAATLSNEGLQRAKKRQQPYMEAHQRQIEAFNASLEYVEDKRQQAIAARDAISAVLEESPNEYFTIGFLKQEGLLDLLTGGEDVMPSKGQRNPPAMQPQVVDTTATTTTPRYPGGVQPVQTTVRRSPLERIPEENLALTLAQSTADPSCATSVLIAAPRRCGKSNLLRQAIANANEMHRTNIDFNIWNGGKDDEDYCGLQKSDLDYLFTAHPANVPLAARLLLGDAETSLVRRCDRWIGYPTLLICDEWNNTLLAAQNADMMDTSKSKQQYRTQLIVGSTQLVTRGPGKLVMGWFSSHSAFVKNVGWDEDIQKNISSIAIARIGRNEQGQIVKYGETMKQALSGGSGKSSWIDDPDTRTTLTTQFEEWFSGNECAVVALTNLLGEWRLARLPNYPDKQPPIKRGPMNQSVNELTR